MLHALPLALAAHVASFLDGWRRRTLAQVSRHAYAVVSNAPFHGLATLALADAIAGTYTPNIRQCGLYDVARFPLDPCIQSRLVVAGIVMHSRYNAPLEPGMLPHGLCGLRMGERFNRPLSPGVFPHGLCELDLGHAFCQPLDPGVFPDTLQCLRLGWAFNLPLVPGALPVSLRKLWLGTRFNQPLMQGALPDGLTLLSCGGDFDQPLAPGVLPRGLEVLYFSVHFNQPLEPGVFPTSLRVLEFGHCFNQPLEIGILPNSLRLLRLGKAFRHPLTAEALPTGHCCCIDAPEDAGDSTVEGTRILSFYFLFFFSSVIVAPSPLPLLHGSRVRACARGIDPRLNIVCTPAVPRHLGGIVPILPEPGAFGPGLAPCLCRSCTDSIPGGYLFDPRPGGRADVPAQL